MRLVWEAARLLVNVVTCVFAVDSDVFAVFSLEVRVVTLALAAVKAD